jgi:hypothetical protein
VSNKYLVNMSFIASGKQLKRGSIVSGKIAENFKNFEALLATGYLVLFKENADTNTISLNTLEYRDRKHLEL